MLPVIIKKILFSIFITSFLFAFGTDASIRNVTFSLGKKSMMVVYNTSIPNPHYLFVREQDNILYVLGVIQGNVYDVFCRSAITTQIPITAKGCDTSSPCPTESSNCAVNDAQAFEYKFKIDSLFHLRDDSPECIRAGGDIFSCLGDVYLVQAHDTIRYSRTQTTTVDMLTAQGFAIFSGFGGLDCGAPTVTWLDVQRPILQIDTMDCKDPNDAFDGLFESYRLDDKPFVNHTFIFKRMDRLTHQRLVVNTLPNNDTHVRVRLATVDGTGVDFFIYRQEVILPANWLHHLPLMNLTLASGCTISIQYLAGTTSTTLRLKPVELPTDLNFFRVAMPPPLYGSSICNFVQGFRDSLGNLVYPNCPEGAMCGGDALFKLPGPFGAPIQVLPDKSFQDWVDADCTDFWSRKTKFRGFGLTGDDGAVYEPYVPDQELCFSPFLDVDKIKKAGGGIEWREKDCFKLGGRIYGATKDVCARPIHKTYCQKGWYYYNQQCRYKFDETKDGKYKVTDDNADRVCASLHPAATAQRQTTSDMLAYLKYRFVFINPKQTGHPYRFRVKGKRCLSLDAVGDTFVVRELSCDVPAFPICVYHIKDVPIPNQEMWMSPKTLRTLAGGQDGTLPASGRMVECSCFNGSGGTRCERQTCGVVNSGKKDPLSIFYDKCYFNNQGTCNHANPRACICPPGYGPPSELGKDAYNDWPCGFPTSTSVLDHSGFIVNGQLYPDSRYAVCGGATRGRGVLPSTVAGFSFLNQGKCECAKRMDLNPDNLGEEELSYDCETCTARVAMLMADGFQLNGDIQERFCNGHGTACPSGERLGEQRLDGSFAVLWNRQECLGKKDGCVCDDGWTGDACTAPIPKNVALNVVSILTPNKVDLSLSTPTLIDHVSFPPDCLPAVSMVQLDGTDCPSVDIPRGRLMDRRWTCGRFGTEITVLLRPNNMTIDCSAVQPRVYSESFDPCGNHPNPYAARFFEVPAYRDFFKVKEPQSSRFAPYGSTNTECMCGPNWTGKLCRTRVSAIRLGAETGRKQKRVCGEGTFPPRGRVGPDGTCECFPIVGMDGRFGGEGCERPLIMVPSKGRFEECFGRGYSVQPTFEYGECEWAIRNRELDALRYPFRGIEPISPSVLTVDRPSIVRIDGKTYRLPSQTKVTLFNPWGIVGPVQYCSTKVDSTDGPILSTVNIPSNATRVMSRLTIRHSQEEVDYCFSNCSASTLPLCSSSSFSFPCILAQDWIEEEEEESIIPSGPMQLICFSAKETVDVHIPPSTSIGYVDCSDPFDRMMDDMHAHQTNTARTCAQQPIQHHTNANGVGYGLFRDVIPGISFLGGKWSIQHDELILSLLGGGICEEMETGEVIHEAVDEMTWDEQTLAWYRQHVLPEQVSDGLKLGLGFFIRKIEVTATQDMISPMTLTLQTKEGQRGEFTIFHSMETNQTVTLHLDPDQEWMELLSLPDSIQVKIWSRPRAYSSLWKEWKRQVMEEHRFPPTDVYLRNCQRLGGVIRAYESSLHRKYLKHMYQTFLAVAYCTEHVQCKKFAQDSENYQCITRSNSAFHPWRGGLSELETDGVGDEGGCVCTVGVSNPQMHCKSCVQGYGPANDGQRYDYRAFRETLGLPPTPLEEDCELPVDPSSSRETLICGGRGTPIWDIRWKNQTIWMDQTTRKIRDCRQIQVGSTLLNLSEGQSYDTSIHNLHYRSMNGSLTLDRLMDRLYWNGKEIKQWVELETGLLLNDVTMLTCTDRFAESPTHRVSGVVKERLNFWISQIK